MRHGSAPNRQTQGADPTGSAPLIAARQAAPSDTYPALGEPLAIELANTLFTTTGRPLDALTSQAALVRWLEVNAERIGAKPPRRPAAAELRRAQELRGVIRTLFATMVDNETPPAASVRRLNEIAALAPSTTTLQWVADAPPKARLIISDTGPADTLFALLAQSAVDVLGGSGAGRLRRCEAPGCVNYYLKDHPRREWCSPKCGNRVRAARHYHRTRGAGA